MEENKWDGVLFNMLQDNKSYEVFFDNLFGFLRRKTDFFSNWKNAESIIANTGKTHIERYQKDKKEEEAKKEEKSKREAEKKKAGGEAPAKPSEDEIRRKIAEKMKEEEEKKAKAAQAPKAAEVAKPAEGAKDGEEKKEEESKAPPGNGGITDRYVWTQTLHELHIIVPVEDHVNKKDITVKIEEKGLVVSVKGQPKPIIAGDWPEKIDLEDSLWTFESEKGKKNISLEIAKFKTYQGWWNCVVKGEPTIDTSKVNPEPSKLSDLDGEMRGQVEKMMFDMRQKQKGEPSSDELLKREKLAEFMKAHPEMDFSKAKFS